MKPPSLMDPSFRYVRAAETNIAKTFQRIRRQQKEAEAAKQAANVRPMKRKEAAK
jgi:hypothetical protein